MTTLLKNIEIANGNALTTTVVSPSIANPHKNRLVARWLVDENSKLYCEWIIED
jgi:hypothetical protein